MSRRFVLFITGLMAVPVYSYTPHKTSSVEIVLVFSFPK